MPMYSISTTRFFSVVDEIPPVNRDEAQAYFKSIFGSDNPIVVEIGSGNGHFLTRYAQTHKNINFIGTEILGGRARKFLRKIEKQKLSNVVVFKGDARVFIWEFLYESMVQEFIILFPEPWPKKRHHKHRLLKEGFIRMLHYRLVKGGKVSVATDHVEYRDWIIEMFSKTGGFTSSFSEGYGPYPVDYPPTLFQKRFLEKGHRIYFMQYKKSTAYSLSGSLIH